MREAKSIILGGVLLLGVLGMSVFISIFLATRSEPERTGCVLDAMLCPDGSSVGRIGTRCEFAPCPVGNGKLQGRMTIGPVCPVERPGDPCLPTPEMFAARKVFVYTGDQKILVTTLTPDRNGKFSANLSAGTYYIDMEHRGIGGISGVPADVAISKDATVILEIDVDTGIR